MEPEGCVVVVPIVEDWNWIPRELYDEGTSIINASPKAWTAILAILVGVMLTAWYEMPRHILKEAPKWSWPILLPLSLWPAFVAVVFGGVALSALILVVSGRIICSWC